MKTKKILGVALLLGTLMLSACGGDKSGSTAKPASSGSGKNPTSQSSSPKPSTPSTAKSITVDSVTLANESGKVMLTVSGTEANYKADDFKWAWGIKVNGDSGEYVVGKEAPEAADYTAATFDATAKTFAVKLNLTDLTALQPGTFYQVYGGTPEAYDNIALPETLDARDQTRHYYIRTDQQNSLHFDSVQPISFTKASVVNVAAADLPTGVTNAGPYLKFGGANAANLTVEAIDAWVADGKVAGNFQRVIGGNYSLHDHTAEERFYKVEGTDVFFYCYIGFIEDAEGWQTHFDCVSGKSGANLQMDATFWGDADHTFVIGEDTYRVYADKTKGTEAEFWGCLGVTRNVEA